MKKVLLLMSIVFIACAGMTVASCSNHEEFFTSEANTMQTSENAAYEMLFFQMDSVGAVYYGKETQTRLSWKKFWRGFRKVLLADAIGAAKGLIKGSAIIEGVASSLGKAVEVILTKDDESDSSEMAVMPEHYAFDDIVLTNCGVNIDSIGYYHNRIIQDIFQHNSNLNIWRGCTSTQIAKVISRIVEDDGLQQVMYEELIEDVLQEEIREEEELYDFFGDTFEELCTFFIQEDPQTAPQLIAIARYIDNMQDFEDLETMKTYSEQVINLVNQSSISEESKSIIKTGLAVAFASAHLWNPDVIEGEIEEEEIEE